jgi:hypothetical protein
MLLSSAPTACTHSCTAIGCFSSVEIRFDPVITEAGQYTFELEADGVQTECEVAFDRTASFPRSGGCDGLVAEGTGASNGSTPPAGPFAIMGFTIDPAEVVEVRVSREGMPWAEHRFEPRYRGVEINGPGCGECPMAREEIALP